MNTFNAGPIGTTQNFRSAKVAQSIQPSKMTIIRQDYVEPTPSKSGTANNMFTKSIPLDTSERVKKLTIRLTDREYEGLQRLFDLVGYKFENLDQLLRDFLLQPEMQYRFLDFLSFGGTNEALNLVGENQPENFGWC